MSTLLPTQRRCLTQRYQIDRSQTRSTGRQQLLRKEPCSCSDGEHGSSSRTCPRRRHPRDIQPASPLLRHDRQCMQAPTAISMHARLERYGWKVIARLDIDKHRTSVWVHDRGKTSLFRKRSISCESSGNCCGVVSNLLFPSKDLRK